MIHFTKDRGKITLQLGEYFDSEILFLCNRKLLHMMTLFTIYKTALGETVFNKLSLHLYLHSYFFSMKKSDFSCPE